MTATPEYNFLAQWTLTKIVTAAGGRLRFTADDLNALPIGYLLIDQDQTGLIKCTYHASERAEPILDLNALALAVLVHQAGDKLYSFPKESANQPNGTLSYTFEGSGIEFHFKQQEWEI